MPQLWSQLRNISTSATPAHKNMLRSAVVAGDVNAQKPAHFGTSDRSSYCTKDFTKRNILNGLPTEARRQQLNT